MKLFPTTYCLSILVLSGVIVYAQPTSAIQHRNPTDTTYQNNLMIVRSAAGDTIEVSELKHGKRNGRQTLYYSNGEVSSIMHYKQGYLHGKAAYYRQGQQHPYKIAHYKLFAFPTAPESLLDGIYQSLGPEGNTLENIRYARGAKNGPYELYHDNGQLKEKGIYQENLHTGRKLQYSAARYLIKDEQYLIIDNPEFKSRKNESGGVQNKEQKPTPGISPKVAVLHGHAKYYHPNGLLSSDLSFRYGKKEGRCKEYY